MRRSGADKAERGAHRAVEKGVGLDRGRPDRFVEPGQKHAIEAEETRFQQAEDHEARMAAARRRSARRGERVVEQRRVFAERSREGLDRRLAPFVHELRQWLEPVRVLHRPCGRRDHRGERSPVLGEAVAQGRLGPKPAQGGERARDIARERFRRLPSAFADAADRGMRMLLLGGLTRRRERAFEIVERGKRDGAKDGELERARRGFEPRASGRSGPRGARGAQDKSAA